MAEYFVIDADSHVEEPVVTWDYLEEIPRSKSETI
jgi:hypothetical protein